MLQGEFRLINLSCLSYGCGNSTNVMGRGTSIIGLFEEGSIYVTCRLVGTKKNGFVGHHHIFLHLN